MAVGLSGGGGPSVRAQIARRGAHHAPCLADPDRRRGGIGQFGEVPDHPAVFVGDGAAMITLWQATGPEPAGLDTAGSPRYVSLSIGIEHAGDIRGDLSQALARALTGTTA